MRLIFATLCCLLIAPAAQGQIQSAVSAEAVPTLNMEPLQGTGLAFGPGAKAHGDLFRMPAHVQENPRGFSPLCRFELEIEEKLPVGVWIKLGDAPMLPDITRTNAYVQFKLFRF